MKKVCLKVGLSYTTKGFSCVKGKPVYVEDDIAAKLAKTGRFDIADANSKDPESVGAADESANIASMKKDELIAFATEHGISIEGCKNNDERIERIQSVLSVSGFTQMSLEE